MNNVPSLRKAEIIRIINEIIDYLSKSEKLTDKEKELLTIDNCIDAIGAEFYFVYETMSKGIHVEESTFEKSIWLQWFGTFKFNHRQFYKINKKVEETRLNNEKIK